MAATQKSKSTFRYVDSHFEALRNAKSIIHVAALAANNEMPPNPNDMYFTLMVARDFIERAEAAFDSYRSENREQSKPKFEVVPTPPEA